MYEFLSSSTRHGHPTVYLHGIFIYIGGHRPDHRTYWSKSPMVGIRTRPHLVLKIQSKANSDRGGETKVG